MNFIEWLRLLIENHLAIQYLIVFLGAAFGGEIAMISLSFLLAQGVFSFYPFVLVCFIGTYSSDIMWFLLGRTETINKIFTHKYTNNTVSMIIEAVHKVSKGSAFIALLLANFMLASRVILIMYVSKMKLNFVKFLYYEFIAVILWMIAVISIGYVSGLGFTYLSNVLDSIYFGIGFVLLIMVVFVFIQIWLKKRLEKQGEKILEEKK